ncbi:hypothetical protein HK104_008772 [Borealophlyctis nickersoniae]|nr:hypothetical protein HK104_008772 [Borealophlyctis nickersoniae]
MPAVASTVFYVRAIKDLQPPPAGGIKRTIDGRPLVLPFSRGQGFFVLSVLPEAGAFFVSTEFSTPFSRTAASGLVPVDYFEVVDYATGDVLAPAPTQSELGGLLERQRQKNLHRKLVEEHRRVHAVELSPDGMDGTEGERSGRGLVVGGGGKVFRIIGMLGCRMNVRKKSSRTGYNQIM